MTVLLDPEMFRLDRATLDRAGAVFADLAPHQLPLIRAVRDGLITLIAPERAAPWPKRAIEAVRRPAIVLLGDDDDRSTGPTGWRCANAASRWPRSAVLHATGGKPEHYAMAVVTAGLCWRVLFVETDLAHSAAWHGLLDRRRIPVLSIVPPPGSQHPAPRPPEMVQ